MQFNLFSKPTMIGIDIQPGKVRLAQVKKLQQGFLLEHLAVAQLPDDIFIEASIKNWQALSSVLSQLISTKAKKCGAVISLPINLVRIQQLQLPIGLSAADIETEIFAYIRRDLPGMRDALAMDYMQIPLQDPAYANIVFTIARQEYISQMTQCMNVAGVKLKIIDVDIYALLRAACFFLPTLLSATETNAVLYATNTSTVFVVFTAQEIIHYQCWDVVDTVNFIEQLGNKLKLSLAPLAATKINKLAIYATNECRTLFDTAALKPLALTIYLYQPDWLTQMRFAAQVDMDDFSTNAVDFLIAIGLAMRESSNVAN